MSEAPIRVVVTFVISLKHTIINIVIKCVTNMWEFVCYFIWAWCMLCVGLTKVASAKKEILGNLEKILGNLRYTNLGKASNETLQSILRCPLTNLMHWLGQSERESEWGRGLILVEFAQKALGTPGKLRPNFQVSEVQFTILWTPLVDYIQCVCTGLHQIARIFQDLSPGEAFVKITDHCLQLCMIRHSLSGVCIEFQCIWSHGPVSNMHSVHSETEAHLWITSGMRSTFMGNIKSVEIISEAQSLLMWEPVILYE